MTLECSIWYNMTPDFPSEFAGGKKKVMYPIVPRPPQPLRGVIRTAII